MRFTRVRYLFAVLALLASARSFATNYTTDVTDFNTAASDVDSEVVKMNGRDVSFHWEGTAPEGEYFWTRVRFKSALPTQGKFSVTFSALADPDLQLRFSYSAISVSIGLLNDDEGKWLFPFATQYSGLQTTQTNTLTFDFADLYSPAGTNYVLPADTNYKAQVLLRIFSGSYLTPSTDYHCAALSCMVEHKDMLRASVGIQVSVVPEPATYVLFAFGALALVGARRLCP
ncbi:PEP-CTERM sorting domain-containing protein [Pelomonas cellulosilytica]|uniref:PEP-CTERM sorting domain-containing protein n=1 Tax=Pelomonas cellulosilytica TaxID=2906762 RepID=A0ABS8XLX6_9BURK|nr:PEP-CTERM sorting domain-containing protein [Pelomonas sp. P8]MCE4553796.1 PEP-CTERM sorting domain-containing protein [Pelomonas sp. P8]